MLESSRNFYVCQLAWKWLHCLYIQSFIWPGSISNDSMSMSMTSVSV